MFKEDIKVAQGWKPGAVSKCMLRKLNRAKLRSAAVVDNTPTKKPKKQFGDKPTLIISKKEGEYTVEMQVPENEQNSIQYDPLIYKIASANHNETIDRRQRKAKRLIKNMLKEFKDPFHPDICQKTCLRSYEEAIGIFGDLENKGDGYSLSNKSCSCEDDLESEGSSMDLDWEIHFSPPNARVNS